MLYGQEKAVFFPVKQCFSSRAMPSYRNKCYFCAKIQEEIKEDP